MKYSLPTLYLLLPCSYALYILPAPLNVSVDSLDFRHNLRWDPGPETPQGTTYMMCRQQGKRKCVPVNLNTTDTRFVVLNLEPFPSHTLYVWAVYNQTESKKARTVFTPFTDTVISPPNVSLTGCGNCTGLELEITPQPLPDMGPHFKNKTIQDLYGGDYSILWKKAGDTKIINYVETSELKLELKDLEPGVKYCVQVRLVTNTNPKTRPSKWACAYTSVTQSQVSVPAILSGVTLASITLLVLGFGLVYTGFMCKLKAHLPRALLATLLHNYILTPERTIPDLVSIDSPPQETVKGVRTKPDPARTNPDLTTSDEEEEEEEDNGNHGYMDRPVGFRSDSNSGRESQDASGGEDVPLPDVARDSGGLSPEVEVGEVSVGGAALRSFTETEVKDYSVRAFLCLEDLATTIQHDMGGEEREGDKLEEVEMSGNVNLFSVTLGTIAIDKEEEEEEVNQTTSVVDNLLSKQQPLLADFRIKASRDNMGSQNEIQTDCLWMSSEYDRRDRRSGYLASHTRRMQTGSDDDDDDDDDDEEEEECSGYMGR